MVSKRNIDSKNHHTTNVSLYEEHLPNFIGRGQLINIRIIRFIIH